MDKDVADPDEECLWMTAGRSSMSGRNPQGPPTFKGTK